ncbi:MAG: hypothetical protein P1U86_01960 [Verrucomicrobiales bacterium]|nr:hypothetical protein [Verrucomicrobiales bacterium]
MKYGLGKRPSADDEFDPPHPRGECRFSQEAASRQRLPPDNSGKAAVIILHDEI